jgi:MFS family permease
MTVIAAAGSVGLLLLAPLPPGAAKQGAEEKEKGPIANKLFETLRMARDEKMQRLILIFVSLGAAKSFIYGTLPVLTSNPELKFVVTSCVGGFVALTSLIFGKLVKRFGEIRCLTFLIPSVFFISLLSAIVLRQTPIPPLSFLFFAACFYGLCDGGVSTVCNALVGRLFPDRKEPAFASMQLLTSGTTALSFAVHASLPPEGKAAALCVLAGASAVALRLLVELLGKDAAAALVPAAKTKQLETDDEFLEIKEH